MASRKKKRNQQKALEKQAQKALSLWPSLPNKHGPAKLVHAAPGAEKMSEVLMEFLEPYSDEWETEDQLRRLLTVGFVAWNAAIAPEDERQKLFESLLTKLPPDVQEDFMDVVKILMEKKKLPKFVNNKRLVLDYHLTMRSDGPYLQIVSTPGT